MLCHVDVVGTLGRVQIFLLSHTCALRTRRYPTEREDEDDTERFSSPAIISGHSGYVRVVGFGHRFVGHRFVGHLLERVVGLGFRPRLAAAKERNCEGRDSAIKCLRTTVAPCALDVYPEAYEEFKHVFLALIFDKDDQTSPVANEVLRLSMRCEPQEPKLCVMNCTQGLENDSGKQDGRMLVGVETRW
ncbi:hypothetical protein RHMOL_Rhmol03G0153200 [Rhododendron molle]|uniref:Uncharacterized protein n=1 Tax=Rhododendron molle TaxID=49168 RepID=A0ACC0PEC3_RHOML|nr:hypothetical protein RHMOL_Rhmol03G0153200 [Rhododendron molle]